MRVDRRESQRKRDNKMSMSMHVTAFRDMDGEFKRMLEVKNFCDAHDVSYPKEVTDYFGDSVSSLDSDTSLYEDFAEIDLESKLREWHGKSYGDGYEIDVADIPEGAETLRFYVSY